MLPSFQRGGWFNGASKPLKRFWYMLQLTVHTMASNTLYIDSYFNKPMTLVYRSLIPVLVLRDGFEDPELKDTRTTSPWSELVPSERIQTCFDERVPRPACEEVAALCRVCTRVLASLLSHPWHLAMSPPPPITSASCHSRRIRAIRWGFSASGNQVWKNFLDGESLGISWSVICSLKGIRPHTSLADSFI